MWGNIAISFLLAFIVSFMATPYSIKIAEKIGAIDIPKDDRRMRKKSIPKLGGLAVITGFAISLIYLISVMNIEGSINLFDENMYLKKLIGVGLGVIIITITGVIDDTKTIAKIIWTSSSSSCCSRFWNKNKCSRYSIYTKYRTSK